MSAVGYQKDPTELILSQLKLEKNLSSKSLSKIPHSYFQVQYMKKQIFKMNPQQAQRYEKTPEQQTTKQYLQETKRDKHKQDSVKYELKKRFFKIRQIKPLNLKEYTLEQEPIEMIKSFSQAQGFLRKSGVASSLKQSQLMSSQIDIPTRIDIKTRYAESFQHLLDDSEKLTNKKSRFKLVGGTMIEKEKINQEIMRQERNQILSIIKSRNYSLHRPQKLQQIPNKEKYSLGYLDYMKTKTKLNLEKILFQKKIRKINGKLEYFQQFILRQGKIKDQPRQRLQNFYIKMREQFRRIERNHTPKYRPSQQ